MIKRREYFIYIMSSQRKALYIGMTNNLESRVGDHKEGLMPGHSKKYKCKKLVYYENYDSINNCIAREKQLKKWRREKKINLIKKMNPEFKDLSEE